MLTLEVIQTNRPIKAQAQSFQSAIQCPLLKYKQTVHGQTQKNFPNRRERDKNKQKRATRKRKGLARKLKERKKEVKKQVSKIRKIKF